MIILSFDVGIKNLAYCLISINLEKQLELEEQEKQSDDVDFLQILKWDVIDLSTTSSEIVTTSVTTSATTSATTSVTTSVTTSLKQCCKCKKIASCCTHSSTMLPEDVKKYCKKHAEETQLPMHTRLLKSNSKNGQNPYLIPLSVINKKISCNKIDIVDLGINLKGHFDSIFKEYIDKIDAIIIENQIGNLAGRMNVLQGMISQYFIMRDITKIEFISATNKLKLFKSVIQNQIQNNELENVIETEKKLYKMRKDAGKKVCRSLLMFYQSLHIWITDYDKHKKRDDLADCFLQGYYYAHLKYNQSSFDLDTFLQNYSSYE
jgi:hypothetical protein